MANEVPTVQLVVSDDLALNHHEVWTREQFPNLILKTITPVWVIFVRAVKAYMQTFVSLITAYGLGATAGITAPSQAPPDVYHTLIVCAGLSLGSAVVSIATNLLALFTALGEKYPTFFKS